MRQTKSFENKSYAVERTQINYEERDKTRFLSEEEKNEKEKQEEKRRKRVEYLNRKLEKIHN